MENNIEKGPERIPSKEEVLEIIARYAEKGVFVRELADEKGIYLLEVRVDGEKEGDTTEYQYMRKGTFPNNNASLVTVIHRLDCEDGIPFSGVNIEELDEATGEWRKVE